MRKTRIGKNMTIRELSRATGITASRISALEMGRDVPTGEEVDILARILGPGMKFVEDEEAKRRHAEMVESLIAIGAVHVEIEKRGLGRGNGGSGDMPCPKCGQTLFFGVAAVNGHVHGRCSTTGCLCWME